eukprot:3705827-Pyramimonas_sp.AAC.1
MAPRLMLSFPPLTGAMGVALPRPVELLTLPCMLFCHADCFGCCCELLGDALAAEKDVNSELAKLMENL